MIPSNIDIDMSLLSILRSSYKNLIHRSFKTNLLFLMSVSITKQSESLLAVLARELPIVLVRSHVVLDIAHL